MVTVRLVKKNGKLTYEHPKDRVAYQVFCDKIKDGQIVEMYINLADTDHSLSQLAKVHACIRELAKESGYTFEEMKVLVKKQSGLCYYVGDVEECKSFKDCSKSEIAMAIEACIEIGKDLNINLA